jgi:hypothetical protein
MDYDEMKTCETNDRHPGDREIPSGVFPPKIFVKIRTNGENDMPINKIKTTFQICRIVKYLHEGSLSRKTTFYLIIINKYKQKR